MKAVAGLQLDTKLTDLPADSYGQKHKIHVFIECKNDGAKQSR